MGELSTGVLERARALLPVARSEAARDQAAVATGQVGAGLGNMVFSLVMAHLLAPGAFADVVGFRADLLDGPVDDLPSQQPALTLVGGRPVHDPDGLLTVTAI